MKRKKWNKIKASKGGATKQLNVLTTTRMQMVGHAIKLTEGGVEGVRKQINNNSNSDNNKKRIYYIYMYV